MGILTKTDIKKLVNRVSIAIVPLDSDKITPLGYDLTLGEIVTLESFADNSEINREIEKTESEVIIPPKSFNLVVCKERVWLSNKIVGTLHARGTLAAKGLLTNSTNVDPNWDGGQMIMSLVNVSSFPIILREDDPYITLVFHTARSETEAAPGRKKTARVLSELSINYNPDKIHKIHEYMNTTQTIYETEFINTISHCKNYNALLKIKFFIKDTWRRFGVIKLVYLFVLFSLLGLSSSLHMFWNKVNSYFNSVEYDSAIFVCQFVSIITLVGLIVSAIKKDVSS